MRDSSLQDSYYKEFKKLRNRLGKFGSREILTASINYLSTSRPIEQGSRNSFPWVALLIVKWSYMNYNPRGSKNLTMHEYSKLIHIGHALSANAATINGFDSVFLLFRAISYQQFIYRWSPSFTDVARQGVLFNDIGDHFGRIFMEKAGVKLSEYFEIAQLIMSYFVLEKSNEISLEWFRPVAEDYGGKIEKILDQLSIPVDQIRGRLRENSERIGFHEEYFEETPFLKFPLISSVASNGKKQYTLTHRNLLFRKLENLVFEVLKGANAEKFHQKFGGIFEKYVHKLIVEAELNHITESDLKVVDSSSKVVDFIIFEEDSNIYIDAKSVEMSSRGKRTGDAEILKGATDKVRKALFQAHSARRILEGAWNARQAKVSYIIVITAKEFYVGSGINFCGITMNEKMAELKAEYGCLYIDPTYLFIMTIEDFERLSAHAARKPNGIADILAMARASDNTPDLAQQKFHFGLHLNDAKVPYRNDISQKHLAEVTGSIISRMRDRGIHGGS